jgi:uridine phosphorylase
MMDLVVRESRAIVRGEMVVLRLGSCGGLGQAPAGAAVVADEGCVMIRRDPDLYGVKTPYLISKPVAPDAELAARYRRCLAATMGESPVLGGINVTAETFYGA